MERRKLMKKLIVLILAAAMVLSLCACGGKKAPAPAAETAVSEASTAASESAAPAAAEEASSAEASSEAAPAAAEADPAIGTIDEDVDYQARDTYKLCYAHYDNGLLNEQMWDAFNDLGEKYNVEFERMTGDADDETFITNLQALVDRGDIDGFIIDAGNEQQNGVLDVMEECGIPFVNAFTDFQDDDGKCIVPTVGLPQYQTGYDSVQYLCDRINEYWGDVDPSKIGFITIDFSVSAALTERCIAQKDCFLANFPENEANAFYIDTYAMDTAYWFTLEGGYDTTAQTISSHPDVEYWIVSSCLENYGQGAARAADDLGLNDKMLITDVGSPILVEEWDNGYDGAWKCCVAISNYAYAAPLILGLCALIDGRTTPENLWPQYKGDAPCAIYAADYKVVCKDDYKDYLTEVDSKFGP